MSDTNTFHNATVCVDFVKKDTFMGTNLSETLLPVCFFVDKVVGNIYLLKVVKL